MPESIPRSEPVVTPPSSAAPAPRFSVIVPAHGVAGRLSQALDSVLGQSPGGTGTPTPGGHAAPAPARAAGDGPASQARGATAARAAAGTGPHLELIVVCAAPDTLEASIADRYARDDPRVLPAWSPPEAGLSGARNTGITAARGDYLLFLDGDDTLAPGALDAIAARLAETGDVDVLFLGHERVHWWKGPLPAEDPFPGAPQGAFAPGQAADAPWLTGAELPAWGGAHRRAFVAAHGLAFPAGAYTDIGWGGLELLAARRVAVLPRVCVRHLVRRQGSRLRGPGEHHFDLLDQVDLVLTRARQGTPAGPRARRGAPEGAHARQHASETTETPGQDAPTGGRLAPDTPGGEGVAPQTPGGEGVAPHPPGDPQGAPHPPGDPQGAPHRRGGGQVAPDVPRPLPGPRLHTLFAALMAQVLRTAAAAPVLLPDGAARVFFDRAGALYRRHRPIGFRPPPGRLGAQHRLLATGAYRSFTALRGARQGARRAARGAVSSAARVRTRHPRHLALYRAALRRPVDENLAVYCAYWGRGYLCSPAAVHAAAQRLAPGIRSVFLVTEEAAERMPDGVEYQVLGTARAWELLARAKYLVNNANFAGAVVKRPGTVHLQTQHGTPLKKMGIEQAEYPVVAAQSGGFGRLLARVDRWDFNLSSNRHSTEVWEREFPAAYETLEYGYPRNDVYQSATAADVARIRRQLGVPEDRTAILYAPTHRDYRATFRAHLDLDEFCAAAGEEFVVLLRAHYFYEDGTRRRFGARVIDVTGHRSAEEVCLAADALVTDYSSIMFDYANLDRPIVVYADDWDVYRETRGVTFDLMECPPGPVATTGAELAEVFRDGSWAGPRSAELRGRFRERFCEYDDGRAAERVVRRVLLGEPPEALPPIVPLAERTPAPAARPTPASVGPADKASGARPGAAAPKASRRRPQKPAQAPKGPAKTPKEPAPAPKEPAPTPEKS